MRVSMLACVLALWGHQAHAAAQEQPVEPANAAGQVRDMAPIVATGVQPGPGMWKVHGPGGHVLWVLGTVSPLPGGLEWKSDDVEAVIARAGVVLGPPLLQVNADVGFFSGMALLPAALRARRNPDGAELEDLLSGTQYARWTALKDQYLGWELGIERWRPMFAAEKLFNAALDEHAMQRGVVDQVVAKAAHAAGREVTPVALKLTVDDPRGLLKDMSQADLGDVSCLDHTMTAIERHMPVLVARANAWATGDTGMLAQLPGADAESDCLMALFDTAFVEDQGVGDIPRQMQDVWVEAAEGALADHDTSFAMVSMDSLLGTDGYLAALAQRGHRVEAPD